MPSVNSCINGLFGSLKKEGEQSRGRESNSITLFESFLWNEWEEFGGVWKGLEGFQPPLTPHF